MGVQSLELILRAKESEYLSTSEAVGIRLRLHTADEEPFLEDLGQSIGVGRSALVEAQFEEIRRIDFPRGNCFHGKGTDYKGFIYHTRYTLEVGNQNEIMIIK